MGISFTEDETMDLPLLLHIPHSSARVPAEYRDDFVTDIETELRCMTDWYTAELFAFPAPRLVFPVSRLVCDVERFRDDGREIMAGRGMGACYTHGHDGKPLRRLSPAAREAILRRWYDPHHARLTELTRTALARSGGCLIVDCHSFTAAPLPYETDQRRERPDICLGTDGFHTPPELAEGLEESFRRLGYSVARNAPYAGALTPLAYYRRERRLQAVMIEVNRGLYLDENCGRNPDFQRVRRDIGRVLRRLAE